MGKYFLLLISLFMAVILASCHDNEPEIIDDDDEVVEKEPLPTYDIIETLVNARTVVYAERLDEMSCLFRNRLNNEKIQPEITPETELVIFDEAGASQFVNKADWYEKLEDFYLRGGLIYFHKPALQAAALVARLQLGVYNEVPDETIPPLYDVYIFNIHGSEYNVGDVYNENGQEITYMDEDGSVHTETIENMEKPSEYMYGRYAENAAKFVNEILHGSDSNVSSRASSYSQRVTTIHCDNTIYLNQKYEKGKNGHHMTKDVTLQARGVASIIARIRSEYNFSDDRDDYYVTLTESYPGNHLWLGEQKIHYKGSWYDKYGGFGLNKFSLRADLTGMQTVFVRLSSYDISNPNNHNELSSKSYVDTKNPFCLSWEFNVATPLKYSSRRALNGTVNDYSKIFTKEFFVEQSWHWVVDKSSGQQEHNLILKVKSSFDVTSGAASSGIGSNHDYNIRKSVDFQNNIVLPSPDRYEDEIRIRMVTSIAPDKVLSNSPTLSSIFHETKHSAVTRKLLIYRLSEAWKDVYNELKTNSPLKGIDDNVTLTLQMSDGEFIPIGDNGKSIINIDKNGLVSMQ